MAMLVYRRVPLDELFWKILTPNLKDSSDSFHHFLGFVLKAPLRGLPPWPRQSLLHPCSCPGYLQHFGPHALLLGFVKGVTVTMSESCVFCLGKKRQDIYRNHVAIPLIKNLGLVKMEELQGYSSNNHGNHGPEKKIIFGWVESCAIAALAPVATTTTTTTTTSIQILLGGLDFCLAP